MKPKTKSMVVTPATDVLAYDIETTGLDLHHGHSIFAWATCDENAQMEVYRIDNGSEPQVRKKLDRLWRDRRPKTAHVAKFDLTGTENYLGRSLYGSPIHDTHKMSHILRNDRHDHSLDHLSWELAGYDRVDAKVRQIAAQCGGYHKIPKHIMTKYQKYDVEREMCLFLFFWPKVQANSAWRDCYQAEIDLIWPTMRMERHGIMIHVKRTKRIISELEAKAEQAKEDIFKIIGRRFNPRSDPQLRKVLYKDLGFPVLKRTSKTRLPALDKNTLHELQEKMKHPIFDPILSARAYARGAKILEGYVDLAGTKEVIHPTINTCVAITGRQSIENPSLQNVQKSGPGISNPYPIRARHCFRPPPGYIFLFIDFSGIEMRLIVHYSQEEEMIRCIREGHGDVHALGAEAFYAERYTSLPSGPEKKHLRDVAKNGGFALAYGATPVRLAVTLGLSQREGKGAYDRYKKRFPKVAGLMQEIIREVREKGYVESVFGRRYYIPASEAYVGTNHLIQGTSAEILKRVEARVDRYNREKTGDEVKMLIPVHDEIIQEYPRNRLSDLPDYLRDVRRLMIDFSQFSVPLEVDASVGSVSWETKREVSIPR